MKEKLSFFTVLSLLILIAFPLPAQTGPEPLPIDPQVRYGELSNGLTYYIRHNTLPKERADFYIVQNVGSILEEENQRGLAHFLEHMAFNGTTHFPDNRISEFTERIGVRFGENLNAYTSMDETVYMITNVPVTVPAAVDSCLLILHDWSGFLTLADDAIEKERGVIREEWRNDQDALTRIMEQQFPKLYPNSQYANRMPIGTIDVINKFKPDELRAYYKKWYRPDLQAVIVVGDIDVDYIENKIRTLFADIPAPVHPAERIWYEVPDNEEPLVSIATDREETNIMLRIMYKYDKFPDEIMASINGLYISYIRSIITTIMNDRLAEVIHKANPPFIDALAVDGDYLISKTKGAWMAAAIVKDDDIQAATNGLVTEINRALYHGFTPSEYERARISLLKDYQTAYNERENQRNSTYSRTYAGHFTNGGSVPGIELSYALINQIAPVVSVTDIDDYYSSIVGGGNENVVLSIIGPDKAGLQYPSEPELLQFYLQAKEIPVEAYVEGLSDEPLITQLPQPGKIVSTIEDPRFGTTVMELSNGAKVILKPTDFKKDEILMTATSPGGSILFGTEDDANAKVFNDVITLGGLGNFSDIDLNKILAGRKVSCSVSLGTSNENVNGYAVPADIETLFQLIYLNFTAKRSDQEVFDSYMQRLGAYLQNLELNPMVAFSDSITKAAYNDDPRMKRLEIADLSQINYNRIMELYRERYADASDFVFSFIGNMDIQNMLPLIETYLASLPALRRTDRPDASLAPVVQSGIHKVSFKRPMETPKASIINSFSGEMAYNLENNIIATFLKQILDLVYTEKIRKDEGGTYFVQVGMGISTFPEGQSTLETYFDTDPEKQPKMSEILLTELQRIADEGPRTEDFNKTKENMLKRYAENQQENVYWLNQIDNYYYRGYDGYTDYLSTLESITPQKIQNFLIELLKQNNSVEVIMIGEEIN